MNSIEVCNYLDGKNLCNFLANLIVEEFKSDDPETRTEITVINSRNFYVVRGRTTSTKVLNLTDIFRDGLKRINPKWDGPLSVIDTIHYNHIFKQTPLLVSLSFNQEDPSDFTSFVNEHAKEDLLFNIKVDSINFVILYDCKEDDKEKVEGLLKTKYDRYKIYKSDFSNDVYISDKYYGLSMNYEKPYHILLKNVSKHIFRMGFSKKIGLSIFSDEEVESVDNLNIQFKMRNEKSVVKKSWLKSLVLDLFPFDQNGIMEQYDLSDYNCEQELLPSENADIPYNKMNKISEFLLV